MANPLSLNYYAYCAGNPLIYVDPSGHHNKFVIGGRLQFFGFLGGQSEIHFFDDNSIGIRGELEFGGSNNVALTFKSGKEYIESKNVKAELEAKNKVIVEAHLEIPFTKGMGQLTVDASSGQLKLKNQFVMEKDEHYSGDESYRINLGVALLPVDIEGGGRMTSPVATIISGSTVNNFMDTARTIRKSTGNFVSFFMNFFRGENND